MIETGYSVQNANRFKWSSVTGNLNPERKQLIESNLEGRKVLDVGCGGGAFVHHLNQLGFETVGVDKHHDFLSLAEDQYPSCDFRQADIEDLPFEDGAFDTVMCFDVLEHVDDYAAIQELSRVASKRLVLAVPKECEVLAQFNITFLHYSDNTHLRYYTRESLADLIDSIGSMKSVQINEELFIPSESLSRFLLCQPPPREPASNTIMSRLFRRVRNKIQRCVGYRKTYRKIATGLTCVVTFE